MDIGVISVRYARALLKGSCDAKIEDKVYLEMQLLAKSYIEVPRLRFTIDNPMISKANKESLLVAAVGGAPCELTKAFFRLVLKEDRESVIRISLYIGNRRTSSVVSLPLRLRCRPLRSVACSRWWRIRLMELWSLRQR